MQMFDNNEQEIDKPILQPKTEEDLTEWFPINDLPSRNHFYPEGTQLYGRALNVKEVKKLAALDAGDVHFIINSVIQNAIKGLPFESILEDDKYYIIFWLRAVTYNEPGYKVSFNCSKCDKKSTYEFDLDHLHIKYLNEFNDKINLKTGDKLCIKPLTINDRIKMERWLKDKSDLLKEDADEDTLQEAMQISEINGDSSVMILDKFNYIKRLTPKNYSQFKTMLDSNSFGVSMFMDVICDKCKEADIIVAPFRREFFIPKYQLGCDS